MSQVYVARKSCGCIVAAFPTNIDKAVKGELLKQLAKGGYDIDQTTDGEVRARFDVACQCNRPPLLSLMEEAGEGVDQSDVDAAATEDLTPDENADELMDELQEEAEEGLEDEMREAGIEADAENVWQPDPVDHPAKTEAQF